MLGYPLRISDGRRDGVTVALAAWLMVGLFVDGWAHNNLSELETFWTPWHGLFYSGFSATAAWVVWNVVAHREAGRPTPAGYGPSMVGLGIFAVGGVGDAVWHTIFGVETGVDALFSPTHLLLFAGIILLLLTPVRALRARAHGRVTYRDALPAVIGTALTVVLLQFFFMYSSTLNNGTLGWEWHAGSNEDLPMLYGILGMLITTAIVFGPTLLWTRRWSLPPGLFTITLGLLGILMSGLEEFDSLGEVVAPVVAGVVIDLTAARLRPDSNRNRLMAFAAAAPVVLWGARMVAFDLEFPIGWPVEMWAGALVWTGLTGIGLATLIGEPVGSDAPAGAEPVSV